MRVALVCPYSFDAPGGVQNHILGLAGWLRHAGHEPRVLGPGQVLAEVLRRRGLTPAQVSSTGAALPIPWNGSVARVSGGQVVARRVRRWLAETGAEVVHVHEPITPSAAFWALAQARAPVIATFHAALPHSRVLALAGRALQPLLRRIDIPLAVSATAAGVVRDHLGLTATVIPNGIEVADFAGPTSTGSTSTEERTAGRRLVFLGRVTEPRKGLAVLLAAVPIIRRAVPDVEILIAGPGERALPEGVRRVGAPDERTKTALLRSADLFIAPHTGRESFGLVLVEAMAAGTPVVAADLPAFVDVLRTPDGELLGRTFPTGDPAALATAVITALTEENPAPEILISQARRYDWESVGPRLLEEYRRALTDRAQR